MEATIARACVGQAAPGAVMDVIAGCLALREDLCHGGGDGQLGCWRRWTRATAGRWLRPSGIQAGTELQHLLSRARGRRRPAAWKEIAPLVVRRMVGQEAFLVADDLT